MAVMIEVTRFDFDEAVRLGSATDSKGRVHEVIFGGQDHLITQCDDTEFCFDRRGSHMAHFQNTRLASPLETITRLNYYILFNPAEMTVYDGFSHFGPADRERARLENEGKQAVVINSTHPTAQATLEQLGLIQPDSGAGDQE